jgi:biofilm protein TabA
MLLDTLDQADRYSGLHPGLPAAFAVLRRVDLATLAPGVCEVDGSRLTYNVLREPARPREAAWLEYHRRYLDVQFALAGAEWFGWRALAECHQPEAEFDEARDVGFFADEPSAWLPLAPGSFVLFYPQDAHAPLVGEGEVHKIVVKVALAWD